MSIHEPPEDPGEPSGGGGGDGPRRGRPSKLTAAVIEAIVSAVAAGNFRGSAAKLAGVGASTFHRWFSLGKKYPESIYARFRRIVLMAEADAEAKAVATIVDAGRDDPKFLCWWLERKYPQRWGRHHAELIEIRQLMQKTRETLEAVEKLERERRGETPE